MGSIANAKKTACTADGRKTKELKDGYAYKFAGSDEAVAKLNEFIKTESECCGFLKFNLITNSKKAEAWLPITGDEAVRDFLKTEIEM